MPGSLNYICILHTVLSFYSVNIHVNMFSLYNSCINEYTCHENKPYMLIRPKYIEGLSNLITFF